MESPHPTSLPLPAWASRHLAEILQEVSALLTESMSLDATFERLFDLLARVVVWDSVSIQLVDEQTHEFQIAAGRGYPDWEQARLIASQITLDMLRARWGDNAVAVVADTHQDTHWIRGAGNQHIRSWVGASLRVKGQIIGVLNVDSATPQAFSALTGETVLAFANQAAVAIENSRLRQREQQRLRRLNVINAVAEVLNTSASASAALPAILTEVITQLGLTAGWFSLWDGTAFHLAAQHNLPAVLSADNYAAMRWQPCRCQRELLAGEMQEPVNTVNCERLTRASSDSRTTIPHASVPIRAGGQMFGMLNLTAPMRASHAATFDAEDLSILSTIGHHLSTAFAREHWFAEVQARASDLSRLYTAAQEMSNSLEPEVLLNLLARHLTEALEATSGYIVEVNQPAGILIVRAEYWSETALTAERATDLGRSYPVTDYPNVFQAVASGSVVNLMDTTPHLSEAERRQFADYTVKSILFVPIMAHGHLLGEAEIWESRYARRFTTNECQLAHTLAGHAAGVLDNARLFAALQHREEYLRRRTAELEALAQVASDLRAANTAEAIQALTLDHTLSLLHATTGMILEPERAGGLLRVSEARGAANTLVGITCGASHSMSARAFITGQTHILDYLTTGQLDDDTLERRLIPDDGAGVSVLLRSGEVRSGVLFVGAPQAFMDEDLRLLTAIAEMAGNALHRANVLETLEQRVIERTHDLAEANERLTELDRLRDQFVSNVSHELRTPLTNISLHLSVLAKKGSTAALAQRLPILQRETRRLTHLIEDLLTISRLDQGRAAYVPELYLLDSLLNEVMETQAARAEAKQLTLHYEPNADAPPVAVDRPAMLQVFTNLVGNAVTYTPPGGHITCRTYLANTHLVAEVHNTGPAIAPEDMPHLFDRFYRGRVGQASGEPGSGLGLAISKEIVERHGGRIEVESRLTDGTTFRCYLPLGS